MSIENYERENKSSRSTSSDPYIPHVSSITNDADNEANSYLDSKLNLRDKPFSVPDSIKPLELWKGKYAINKEDIMEHDLALDHVKQEYTYNVVWKLNTTNWQLLDPSMVTRSFITNINELLASNNITTLEIEVSAGIGTQVWGKTEKWSYVGRLTAKFKINEPNKQRVTAIEGLSHYAIADWNNTNIYPFTLPREVSQASNGMKEVEKEVFVWNQKAKFSFFYREVSNIPREKKLRIWSAREALSNPGMRSYPIFRDWKQVGSIMKCEAQPQRKSKVMFANVTTNPWRFTKTGTDRFPNISAIKQWLSAGQGKRREITMVTTGPYYQSGTTMSGVAYVRGTQVGSERLLANNWISDGRAVANINAAWELHIQHASELWYDPQQQSYDNITLKKYITEKRDIVTMSSLIRNGNINTNASLRNHPNAHAIVTFADWVRGEVIINGVDAATKQAIMSSLMHSSYLWIRIDRAMYADGDAYQNYLDGIFVNRQIPWQPWKSELVYSHPDRGDIMRNPTATPGQVAKDNMPGIMIFYAEEQ